MALWVAVHGLKNNEELEESVLNRPLYDLTERTNYLYERLQDLIGASPFEAVRFIDVPLDISTDDAPVVGDVVYLDPVNRVYKKALASIAVDDVFTAGLDAYAIGILSAKDGSSGTIVARGKLSLSTGGAAWQVADLLEEGEIFANGQYYLSNTEKGKLTAYPSGPAIFIGQFMADESNPEDGDYAILAPDYKDLAESHQHRAYPMYSQPAGQQVVSGTTPADTHSIIGFSPEANIEGTHDGGSGLSYTVLTDSTASFPVGSDNDLIGLTLQNVTQDVSAVITANTGTTVTADMGAGNEWDDGDEYVIVPRARLVLYGAWMGNEDVQYTVWISNSSNDEEVPGATSAPASWADAYLHWQSTDSTEGTGAARIWSYDTEVSIGTKGVIASLENVLSDNLDTVVGTSEDTRKWIISIPEQTRGWLNRDYRLVCDDFVDTDNKYSILFTGGPHTSDDDRQFDTLTVKGGTLFRVEYTGLPSDGDTITIGGATFEFDNTGAVTGSNIAVTIEGTDDATYANLLDTVIAQDLSDVDVVLDEDNGHFLIVYKSTTISLPTLSITNATSTDLSPVVNDFDPTGSGASVVVFDEYHRNLVDDANSYWNAAKFWVPQTLKNGLNVVVVPYDIDGDAATATTYAEGDYWVSELVDEAPGASFRYSTGMHQSLSQYYPPIPKQAASLILNGVELDSKLFFPLDPTYDLGNDTIYWYSDQYAFVPWPRDWVNVDDPGTFPQNMVIHFVRMTIGNSGIVTSLQPAPGAPIRVLQCGTNEPGTVGDLALDLDLALEEDDANLAGFQVFKNIEGQKLIRGPVVEKILPGSGISIAQSAGAPNGQGTVTISANDNTFGGDFEEIALENAKQELIGMFPYIRLLEWDSDSSSNIPTGFVAKFRVPHTVIGRYRVVVYATVFGESDIPFVLGGTREFAGIDFNYNILPDFLNPEPRPVGDTFADPQWYSLVNNLVAPTNVRHVEIPFGKYDEAAGEIYTKYDPMLIHNDNTEEPDDQRRIVRALGDPFPNTEETPDYPSITQGDLVAIRISRADITGGGTEYTNRIGFINLRWRLIRVG